MDNHSYNLIKAMGKKAQAIWRYEQYIKDSAGCAECLALWNKLKNEDTAHLEGMKKILSGHAQSGAIK